MTIFLSFLLVFAIGLNLFPPKKPNYLFGYQLGSSKKSLEHWKVANKYASSYLILLYSLTIILSIIQYKQKLDLGIPIITIFIIGLVLIYFLVEKKLKKVD
ncbi:MAG: SdpI family protein [Flavobacterium sp.]|uniref:SdpI family protein n=1 Tax=Flavobacterium sp. TaxID=239 RepID=UPI0022C09B84|nr:SdpI family protein [Flavobacterium sp.]MCZ8330747.1 SdpI family protein [Flavobacterium sp.]